MIDAALSMPRNLKRLVLVLSDAAILMLAVWLAFVLRFEGAWAEWIQGRLWLLPLVVGVTIPVFFSLGLYRSIIRYFDARGFVAVARAITLGLLVVMAIWAIAAGPTMPRAIWLIFWTVALVLISASRLAVRSLYLTDHRSCLHKGELVAIYGAGNAGVQLAIALQRSNEFRPELFLDDNAGLQGSDILGLKVYSPERFSKLMQQHRVTTILLAIPSLESDRRREIIQSLETLPVHVMVVPGLAELASGIQQVDDLREVDVEDILGRDPVEPDDRLMGACIRGKSVLVTGAGGSIGSELCRQIISESPNRLVIFEISEFGLYNIERELRRLLDSTQSKIDLVPILGSVCDLGRLQSTMSTFKVQTVYHAAAYKHVPIVEHNPVEGVKNNIFGTYHAAMASIETGVETFVLISTDKAVRPTNVMGATKRFAELILQALTRQQSRTRFCMVRFGNVLASSGSVVPLFREQIRKGGPITVTHPDIVRYFMTIGEAAQLVIQAGSEARGGDVFLLDIGEPVRIVDLARRMIHLYGFEVRDEDNPDGDIEIQITGLRSGEKLYEELLIGVNDPTEHPKIMRAQEETLAMKRIENFLQQFEKAVERQDYVAIRQLLLQSIQGYKPENGIEDRVWLEQDKSSVAATAESASSALH